LSAIVMKLLAKTAEQRYQTAAGVEADLRRGLEEWESHGRIDPFPLGAHDASDRLLIPEKLYGRGRDIDALIAAFGRVVANGTPELVLVSGYSGIGKSSVVHELHRALVPPRGLFASGKFDQYKRDIPYTTLGQAFQSLVRSLLSKSEAELGQWRGSLSEALGPNGHLIVNLVPELELVIGQQPPVPDLPPRDAQNRFQSVFRRFIGAFATREHPLALFLDDLQWLDAATLDLLEHLVTHSEVRHLLLVGAYRDNEVGPSHPLVRTLETIRKAGARVQEIVLAPLGLADIGELVSDALHCEPENARPLAQLVHQKTGGNPFFAIQFFTALAEGGLLAFDPITRAWRWNVDRIRAVSYTDNVVDLMTAKLKRLSSTTQEALKQFACLGNVAPIATLALVHGETEEDIHGALWEAVHAGLVFREDNAYRFLHDRIQQTAYSLIPDEQRSDVHLRIGRALLASLTADELAEHLFDVANQLNRGATRLIERDEKALVAAIELRAGRKAKASAAYASANVYLAAGMALLDETYWASQYELMFSLRLECEACEFLTGQFDTAEQLLAELLQHAASKVDRAAVYHQKILLHTVKSENAQAVDTALACLRVFGIDLAAHPTPEQVQAEQETVWQILDGRPIESLIELPLMTDPELQAAMQVLSTLIAPAYFTDPNLFRLLLCRMVNVSIQHGMCGASTHGCAHLGIILGPVFHRYSDGYLFGKLACDLVDKHGFVVYRGKAHYAMGTTAFWTQPMTTAIDFTRSSFHAAIETGDLTAACYDMFHICSLLFLRNDPLDAVWRESEMALDFAREASFGDIVDIIRSQQRFIATMQGRTANFSTFSDSQFDEAAFEAQLTADRMALKICWYWILKLMARFLSGDYAEALAAADKAKALLWTSSHRVQVFEYFYYTALTVAALYENATADKQNRWRELLTAHLGQLREWADNYAPTFADKHALVSAEIARLEGRDADAMRLYEEAIHSAGENGFVQNEGLAHEAAARFYAARGVKTIARACLREARRCYLRWGAFGKVRQLEQLHPHLRDAPVSASPTATIGAPVGQLDVGTVLKASQAVSGEIVLGELIKTLLRIAVEHAGAERGLLILFPGDEPRIAAEATTGPSQVEVTLREMAAVSPAELPKTLLHTVIRTRQSVILDDASAQNPFSADEYICQKHARSVLCLPLVKQAKLIGVLYLENSLASHVFTPDRISVLELLASQAAISLENARLYGDLQEREARIRRLVDSNIIGIIIWDLEGRIIEANQAFLDMLGYSREDLISGRLQRTELTPAQWRDADDRAIAELKAAGSVQPREKEYFRKDGSRVPVLVGAANLEGWRAEEGVAFVLDLSERKRAEYVARLVFNSSPDRISIVGRDYRWQRANPALERRWGISAEKFIGRHVADFLGADTFEQTAKPNYDRCFAGEEVNYAGWFNLALGRRYLAATYTPLRPDSERVEAALVISRDLTEHMLASEALREAQIGLAHANRVTTMGQLTASIAHEVNQPLAGVIANAEAGLRWLDRETPDIYATRRSLEWIIDDGNRANEVIRRVRSLAKKTDLEMVSLVINDVVREVIALVQRELTSHQALLRMELAPALPMILGDRIQLQQVIINLVMNGAEAMQSVTDRPRELVIRSHQDETQQVFVGVTDSGVGISAEDADRLFNPFFTTKSSGMGMGLSICRSIIEAHRGRLWVKANMPHGATFQFTLPVNADTAS
ncbi:MAG: multi-sensor signal transduction multi-kinase, partial [Bradyrhizobium sp.]|nr:multi-sensor signal transduction multi-kinase [Bradyrhizobium sp.]